jgi:hypothetical protein
MWEEGPLELSSLGHLVRSLQSLPRCFRLWRYFVFFFLECFSFHDEIDSILLERGSKYHNCCSMNFSPRYLCPWESCSLGSSLQSLWIWASACPPSISSQFAMKTGLKDLQMFGSLFHSEAKMSRRQLSFSFWGLFRQGFQLGSWLIAALWMCPVL